MMPKFPDTVTSVLRGVTQMEDGEHILSTTVVLSGPCMVLVAVRHLSFEAGQVTKEEFVHAASVQLKHCSISTEQK